MENASLAESKRVFSKLQSAARRRPAPPIFPEEYVALLNDIVIAHSRTKAMLKRELRIRGINLNKIKIVKARVKLVL